MSQHDDIIGRSQEELRCIENFLKLKCIADGYENHETSSVPSEHLDLDRMCRHILDCMSALLMVKELKCRELKQTDKDSTEGTVDSSSFTAAKMTVFGASLQLVMRRLINRGSNMELKTPEEADHSTCVLGCEEIGDWLPLHWAAAVVDEVGEDAMKIIYVADPSALRSFQMRHISPRRRYSCGSSLGYTPLHLLCMSPQPNLSLLRHFAKVDPSAFEVRTREGYNGTEGYPLHVAAKYCSSVEALQLLLQITPSHIEEKSKDDGWKMLYPLSQLFTRRDIGSQVFKDMFECLLEANHGTHAIRNAIESLVHTIFTRAFHAEALSLQQQDYLLGVLERLVLEYPDAVWDTTGTGSISEDCKGHQLLHYLVDIAPSVESVEAQKKVFQLLVKECPDAVRSVGLYDELPVLRAAYSGSFVAVQELLDAYPESVTMVTSDDRNNILHRCGLFPEILISCPEVSDYFRSLCSRYPELLKQRNSRGLKPLHEVLYSQIDFDVTTDVRLMRFFCELDPQIVRERIVVPNGNDGQFTYMKHWRSSVPLHLALYAYSDDEEGYLLFEYLLRLYPEAANIKDGRGETPYEIAKRFEFDPRFLRLLLRGAPEQDPAELRRLNWAERRMAMFLSYKAVVRSPTPTIFAELRFENKDLLKRVISFL